MNYANKLAAGRSGAPGTGAVSGGLPDRQQIAEIVFLRE